MKTMVQKTHLKKNRTRQVDIMHVCGPCTVWSQCGGKEEHLRHHTGAKRYPGPIASEFSSFLSCGEKRFDLKPDSCMCNSCHRDCSRGINRPRWYTLHEKRNYHCSLCCSDECTFHTIDAWGPPVWNGDKQQWVRRYLQLSGHQVLKCIASESSDHTPMLCKKHYRYVERATSSRTCKICSSSNASSWVLGETLIQSHFQCECTLDPVDWVCKKCSVKSHVQESKFASPRKEILEHALQVLENDGALIISHLIKQYKNKLCAANMITCDADLKRELTVFRKVINTQLKFSNSNYDMYYPRRKSGSMCYDKRAFSGKGVVFVYKMLCERNQKGKCDCMTNVRSLNVRSLVRKQCEMLPKSKVYDYRSLAAENTSKLEAYFYDDLMCFVDQITTPDRVIGNSSKSSGSKLYMHNRKHDLFPFVES